MPEEIKEFLIKHQDDIKTRQDLFDFIVERLIAQGRKSLCSQPSYKNCAYRGDNDTRCAVGMVIKDEFYTESLEGASVGQEGVLRAVKKSLPNIELEEITLRDCLQSLQDIHDSGAFIEESGETKLNYELNFDEFKRYAKNEGLEYKF